MQVSRTESIVCLEFHFTGKQWKLTTNKQSEVYHDWFSDGKWLVTDISDAVESRYDIALINWETKEMKILTDTTFLYQQSPNFVLVIDNNRK